MIMIEKNFQLIDEYEERDRKTLQQIFKKQRCEILLVSRGDDGDDDYPMGKITAALGVSRDLLRKRLNGSKKLTRDWLVAICAAYGLDENESCDALVAGGMPRFDEEIKRDRVLMEYLCSHSLKSQVHRFKPSSIADLNYALEEANLPLLDIQWKNKEKLRKPSSRRNMAFKEIRNRVVRVYSSEGDPYDSLETEYLPELRCVAAAFLEDSSKKQICLEAFSDGAFHITEENDVFPQVYMSLDEVGDYKPVFRDLAELARKEKRRVDDLANDTRNYRQRCSANLKNDAIHVFLEEYNYAMPERNEYYFMEYIDGHYALSISHASLFMQAYLPYEEYCHHYSSRLKAPFKTYNSIVEIEEAIHSGMQSYFYPDLLKQRKQTFLRLQKTVENKLEQIRNKKVYIRNLQYIWDNPAEVLRYYGIEKEYSCSYDEESGELVVGRLSANILDENGTYITVTFEDVCEAFELGYKDIQQICRVKRNTGSISSVLK